jgi:hypothetical protein
MRIFCRFDRNIYFSWSIADYGSGLLYLSSVVAHSSLFATKKNKKQSQYTNPQNAIKYEYGGMKTSTTPSFFFSPEWISSSCLTED